MKNKVAFTAIAAVLCGSVGTSTAVLAQDLRYDREHQSSRYDRHHHVYHGQGGDYRRRCGGGNGAVGTVGGGVGGAVLGNVLGGGVLGTVAGGVGGALVGRHFDKTHTRHRNGC